MQLLIFKYKEENEFNDLTTIEIDGQIWFLAIDVCKLLDIQNSRQAVATLDEDEKLMYTLYTSGQKRLVNLINESGLYGLVFRSKKLSAKKFRKWITKEVIPSIRKTGAYGINRWEIPNFIIRYNENWHQIDKRYFSVITELFTRLFMRFEKEGYSIPNKALNGQEIRPDASIGKCFAAHLRNNHPPVSDHFSYYEHVFPNGIKVQARQYPNELLPLFIKYLDDFWIPNNAESYFMSRDRKALDYLPKLLS